MPESTIKITGSPEDFEKTVLMKPATIYGSTETRKPLTAPPVIGKNLSTGINTGEKELPPLPDFISKNKLKEIVSSDPRLQQSKEARRLLVKGLLARGKEIEGLNAKFDFGEMASNIPESAKELGKSFIHLFTTNPLTTVKGLSSVALGALEKAVPGAQSHEEAFNAVADAMVERYGSTDKILNTIEKDPVGFASDLASVLTGVGGAIKGGVSLGAKASLLGTRGASALTKTAEALSRAGNIVDPVNIALKGGLKATTVLEGQPALKSIRAANKAIGAEHLIKKTDVNETMIEGLGLSSADRAKLSQKLGSNKYGEDLAKLGITGTLPDMANRSGEIAQKTKQVYDETLDKLSKPVRTKTRPAQEIDNDIVTRMGELEAQRLPMETDPILQRLDAESRLAYSENLRPPRVNTFKVQAADKALDQLHTLYGGSKVDFADILKSESEQTLKNIGLSPKETYQVTNKTLTEDIGKRLTNLGIDPDDTPRNVMQTLNEAANESVMTLDKSLAKVKERYTTKVADKVLNNLSDIRGSLPYTKMSKRLQDEQNRIVQLITRNENNGLTLSELNETKRLLDDMAGSKVFTNAGDVKTSTIGENLSDLRKELRHYIEVQANKSGIPNVRELNSNTQFAKELSKILEKKIKSGLTEPTAPQAGKFTSVEFEHLRQQLKDLRVKNKEKGLTLAELNKIDDSISGALKGGVGKADKTNLEALQKNIREVIDFNAKKQGVTNLQSLRDQRNFADTFKSLLDYKIARGGDKVAKSKLISEHMNNIVHQAVLNQSKLGRLTALSKVLFQVTRNPQFQRDLAAAVQLLKDGDYKKLVGGITFQRPTTKLAEKYLRKQSFYKANDQALQVMDSVIRKLSTAYPVLRGLRITGKTVQEAEKTQEAE